MNCKRRDCGVSARAIVNTCGWGFVVLVVRGRSVGGRGVVVVARLLVGEYGYHVLVEEVVEGHRLVAVWTWAADVDSAGEDAAGWAALFTEETVTAGGALVDGELAAWPGGGGGDGGQGLLVASAKRGLAAGWAAVGLPAGGGGGSFDEAALVEAGAGAHERDELGCVDRAPPSLGGLDEFERHGQAGGLRAGAFGDLGPVTDGGEGRLDRVGGAQMDPVLGGEVVEREQLVEIVGDLGDGLAELVAVGQLERGHGAAGVLAVLGVPDFGEGLLRPGVGGLGQRGEHVADLVEPAALLPGGGEHLPQRRPEPQRAVAGGQDRGAHPAPGAVA